MTLIQGVAHVRTFVHPDQWDAALQFYEKTLGLKCVDRETGIFRLPDRITIGIEKIAREDPEEKSLVGRLLSVSFRVGDVDRVHRDLSSKGIRFHGAPEKQPWGGTLAFCYDPAGNLLPLVEYPPERPRKTAPTRKKSRK